MRESDRQQRNSFLTAALQYNNDFYLDSTYSTRSEFKTWYTQAIIIIHYNRQSINPIINAVISHTFQICKFGS